MIKAFKDHMPEIHEDCFVAENATVVGRVKMKKGSNVWYGVVIRADSDDIVIGENTNIQDNTVIHCDEGIPTLIGTNVTVGHGAIIHACSIGDNVLVGMGSIILDGAVIGDNVIVGAGTLVPPCKKVPSGVLIKGSPYQVVRELTLDEIKGMSKSAEHYVTLAAQHK